MASQADAQKGKGKDCIKTLGNGKAVFRKALNRNGKEIKGGYMNTIELIFMWLRMWRGLIEE